MPRSPLIDPAGASAPHAPHKAPKSAGSAPATSAEPIAESPAARLAKATRELDLIREAETVAQSNLAEVRKTAGITMTHAVRGEYAKVLGGVCKAARALQDAVTAEAAFVDELQRHGGVATQLPRVTCGRWLPTGPGNQNDIDRLLAEAGEHHQVK